MASGEHLKALLRSHIKGDDSHFLAVAMQMAAHEAKQGHGSLLKTYARLSTPPSPSESRFRPDNRFPLANPEGN